MTDPGDIFLIGPDGRLLELAGQPYDSEDLLQALLARHPELLAGRQMDPAAPRRWLLVTREAGVPDRHRGGTRWSVDHLFLDQDGIPTLIEVKRSSDTRVRREVVGQMLDYAANCVVYWPVETLQERFRAQCQQVSLDPEAVLAEFLGAGEPADVFWGRVKANLQAGHIRMVFVADEIPAELRRIVEFLNVQMHSAEVLAVEIRQYMGEGVRTLVPRVIGRTEQAQVVKNGANQASRQWDEPSFFAELTARHGLEIADVARAILSWGRSVGLDVWWGRGQKDGSFILWREGSAESTRQWVVTCWTYGRFDIPFEYMRRQGAFAAAERREELRLRLNQVPGLALPSDSLDRRPSTPLAVLVSPEVLCQFLSVLAWMVESS
jgi:hypothetical protein